MASSLTSAVLAEGKPADSSAYGDVERFDEGDASSGARLYKRYCRGCHGEDGRGGAHTFMPHIGNLTKKGYIEVLPDSYLYTAIADGGEAVGKSGYMPAWKTKLTDREVKDLVAHIRAMPTY
ncbi:MAG: cytochrome c [Rhizobiales bacterium]|nr:cytochrome c [Hyphomicrobiales bacterium]